MMDASSWLNPREAGKLLGVTYQTAYNWVNARKFPNAVFSSKTRRWLIPLADVCILAGREIPISEVLGIRLKRGRKPTGQHVLKIPLPKQTVARLEAQSVPGMSPTAIARRILIQHA